MNKTFRHRRENRNKPPILSLWLLAFAVSAAITAVPVLRAAEKAFSDSRTVMVVTDKGEVFVGDKSIGTLRSGTVVHYAKENGSWLLAAQFGGWVNRDHVVPIERALAHFDRLLATQPKDKVNPEIYHHRGIVKSELNDQAGAIADYQQAITLGLKSASVYVNRAIAYQRSKNRAKSLIDLTEALRLSPEHSTALFNRAQLLFEDDHLPAALADCNAALKSDPRLSDAYNLRGTIYLKQQEYQKAIADFSAAIKEYPKYAEAIGNRGFALKNVGKYADALKDFELAMQLNPGLPYPFNDAAWLLATCPNKEFRDPEKALALSRVACERTQFENSELVETYAAAQAALGRIEDAVKWQTVATQLSPSPKRGPRQNLLNIFLGGEAYVEKAAK